MITAVLASAADPAGAPPGGSIGRHLASLVNSWIAGADFLLSALPVLLGTLGWLQDAFLKGGKKKSTQACSFLELWNFEYQTVWN